MKYKVGVEALADMKASTNMKSFTEHEVVHTRAVGPCALLCKS